MSEASLKMTPFSEIVQSSFNCRSEKTPLQKGALDRFERLGLPHRRVEGWKWSDFSAALRGGLRDQGAASGAGEIAPSAFADLAPIEIRIIDGRIDVSDDNAIDGIDFGVIDPAGSDPDFDEHPLVALNIALTRRAFGYRVKTGVKFARPIHIRHIATKPGSVFSQVLGRAEEGSEIALIETFEGDGSFQSAMHHLAIYSEASVRRYVLHDGASDAVTHGFMGVMVGQGARYQQRSLSFGGKLCRHETHLLYPAANADSDVMGAALLGNDRHHDFTTQVRTRGLGCRARQLHKSVAAEGAKAVFQGKFHVERPAQKTDAQMAANALLLSEGAEANHKPELEIYADDVECAHGSTCGAIDDDALFYLRQRGLSEEAARSLLIDAFVGEVIDGIDDDAVRAIFADRVAAWLEARA